MPFEQFARAQCKCGQLVVMVPPGAIGGEIWRDLNSVQVVPLGPETFLCVTCHTEHELPPT
jgi:hypothetical protein